MIHHFLDDITSIVEIKCKSLHQSFGFFVSFVYARRFSVWIHLINYVAIIYDRYKNKDIVYVQLCFWLSVTVRFMYIPEGHVIDNGEIAWLLNNDKKPAANNMGK